LLKLTSRGGKQGNDILDSLVGFVIRSLQFAVRAVVRIGPMVKTTVGERTAQTFVKEEEEQGDLDTLCCELIGIAAAIAFQQAMAFQFAQIVAKLVQSVGFRGELKRGQNGLMDLFGGPAADSAAAMQQDFQ